MQSTVEVQVVVAASGMIIVKTTVLQLLGLTLLIIFPSLVNWFPAMVYGQ